MRRTPRLIAAAVLIAFTGILGGCSSFDPSDMLDFLDTKKKLPGDRKPVFPEGVPGLEQGVPREMYKGAAQQQPDPNAPAVAALPAEPPPEAKPAKGTKAKKTKQPASTAARRRGPAGGRAAHGRSAAQAEDRAQAHHRPAAGSTRPAGATDPDHPAAIAGSFPGTDAERQLFALIPSLH
ncbi:VgrG protein CDS [Bradyrhizobium sp.]|nr:VgrG protein CDS [Bradyrhizobium sp.]